MHYKPEVVDERAPKRPKVQQAITNMFTREGPKFVEVVGVQLLCPYCHKKFKAPQGLVSHKHMHERAGHVVQKQKKRDVKRPLEQTFPIRRLRRKVEKSAASQILIAPPKVNNDPERENTGAPPAKAETIKRELMTRRFSISEKLMIIKKAKEMDNISATCRQVQKEFRRKTFDRKSLKAMLQREEVYQKAAGTKKVRKTVRNKTGMFPRMESELAK